MGAAVSSLEGGEVRTTCALWASPCKSADCMLEVLCDVSVPALAPPLALTANRVNKRGRGTDLGDL